ncbi:serine/threonine-protein kinase RIO3-like [Liolophura sinensis]|uniref:serine/threonine-protein kinase RIO3-like n=1 Tax=Liolophura sinensis TaxID=3198878 RepID=UPI003159176B
MEGSVEKAPVTVIANTGSNPWNKNQTSSPWGKPSSTTTTPCSFQDVMSEQLAVELTEEDHLMSDKKCQQEIDDATLAAMLAAGVDSDDTKNDILLAEMLQHEFDKEFDQQLQRKENKLNGTSKVSISFLNYRSSHPALGPEEGDEEDLEEQSTGWDEPSPVFNRIGISGKGKNITTKHDAVICGRRNATRMMEFPPEFEVGDGEGMDMKLPNHVYNKLKLHSLSENKRSHRVHEKKEHSTAEHVMDERTRLLIYKLVNIGLLESVTGSISAGKESIVFHAFGGSVDEHPVPEECAIKVYKTTLNEFKTREKYVHGDHRFIRDDYKKFNPRKIIRIWAEKETCNLNRMRKFNIPCPSVVALKKHVLVMSFVGKDQKPAPKLKEVRLPTELWQDAYEQTVTAMKTLHNRCLLVHADLSEYNLLWHEEKVWFIDVSQAVDVQHPKAFEFLYRDCINIVTFFKKQGVYDVPTPEALFNDITDLSLKGEGEVFLIEICRYEQDRSKSITFRAKEFSKKEYAFDYFFEESVKEKKSALAHVTLSDSEEDSPPEAEEDEEARE